MHAPTSIARLIQLGLQDDRDVLLHLPFDDAKPTEVRLAMCDLEKFFLIANCDVPRLTRVRMNIRTFSTPQIPFRAHPTLIQIHRAGRFEFPFLSLDRSEIEARPPNTAIRWSSCVV